MSISVVSRSVNQVIPHSNPSFSDKTAEKILTDLPEEILLQIAEDLLPADDTSFKDLQNFQYVCKLFLRIGRASIQSSFWWSFFNFENMSLGNAPKIVDKKIYSWLGVRGDLKSSARWAQLDNLIRMPGSKIFDAKNIWDLLRYGRYSKQPLSNFVKLGALKKEDIDGLNLSQVQESYATSEPGLLSILKKTPNFNFFKNIPDSFLWLRNYDMIKKALKEDRNVFDFIIKSKICLYYPDRFSGLEPFIEAVSKPSEKEMMHALYPHVDAKASYMRGKNAIHAAAESGNVDALIFLCGKGVDFKKRDYKGRSPLFSSVLSHSPQHQDFTKKLIEYGESASVVDSDGNTILMVAAQESDALLDNDLFSYLINSGAKVNAVNNFKENILHILFGSKKFEKFFRLNKLFVEREAVSIKEMMKISEICGEDIFFTNMMVFINYLFSQSKTLLLMGDENNETPVDILQGKFGDGFFEYILDLLGKFNRNCLLPVDVRLAMSA